MSKIKNKLGIIVVGTICLILSSCDAPENINTSGESASGYNVGISAIYGDSALPADGSSQATVRVEVWDSSGYFVNNISVTLTASLGTLDSYTLTTNNGVATTTFTAGSVAGNGAVTATVENISAFATIVLANY